MTQDEGTGDVTGPAEPSPAPDSRPLDRTDTSTWPALLTVGEAAHVLSLHPETVRIMLREGRMAGVHIGRSWYIRKSDLLEGPSQPHG